MKESLKNPNDRHDPWGLFGKEFPSRHCQGKKATVIMYDHTGAVLARCECGVEYWHDQGAYKHRPELNTPEAINSVP